MVNELERRRQENWAELQKRWITRSRASSNESFENIRHSEIKGEHTTFFEQMGLIESEMQEPPADVPSDSSGSHALQKCGHVPVVHEG